MSDIVIKEYGDSLKQEAEHLIIKLFPEKIDKLNDLLEKSNYQRHDLSDVHHSLNIPIRPPVSSAVEPKFKQTRFDSSDVSNSTAIDSTRVHVIPKGTVPCNKNICDLIQAVKPHIRQLVEDSILLKMWISFLIPKIEDGNNFGVSIQKIILIEIESVQSATENLFEEIVGYFILRAKIVSKVSKYPYIDDYRRAVIELDEKQYLSLWQVVCEIRNHYCSLHDVVVKNLDKIKKPRTSNAESLY